MSSEKAKARRKWVEKQVKKFTDEMKAQGIDISSKFDEDSENGEAHVKRLRIEMEKGGEVEAWARRERLLQDIKAIKKEQYENEHGREIPPSPAGTIPLTPEQMGTGGKESWDSYEELIDDLHRAEQSGDTQRKANAEHILNEMFHKAMVGQRAPFEGMEFKGKGP